MEAVLYIVVISLTIIPLMRMLPAFGLNPYWAVVAAVPPGLIGLLWVMAGRIDRLKGPMQGRSE
ncbi:MAG: hypothetical protein ACXIUV_10855 [Alkalilacustris sp.]